MPIPPIIPVINLLKLVDSNNSIYCINQSKNITPKRKIANIQDGFSPRMSKNIILICPIKTPVQRAQTGNCLPLK